MLVAWLSVAGVSTAGVPVTRAPAGVPVTREFPGGVVDGGDVVGVERVAEPQRVGGNAEANAENAGGACRKAFRCHNSQQHTPAHSMQEQHNGRHSADRCPFPAGQRVPGPSSPGLRGRGASSFRLLHC